MGVNVNIELNHLVSASYTWNTSKKENLLKRCLKSTIAFFKGLFSTFTIREAQARAYIQEASLQSTYAYRTLLNEICNIKKNIP